MCPSLPTVPISPISPLEAMVNTVTTVEKACGKRGEWDPGELLGQGSITCEINYGKKGLPWDWRRKHSLMRKSMTAPGHVHDEVLPWGWTEHIAQCKEALFK